MPPSPHGGQPLWSHVRSEVEEDDVGGADQALSGGNAVQPPLQKEELRPQRGGFWPWPDAHTELGIGPSPLTPAASPGSLSRQGRKQPLGPNFTSEEVNGG